MDTSITITASAEITFDNSEWASVMDQGKGEAIVDSPTIELPQGGTAQSEAAVIHGQTFHGTDEPGSNFIQNGYAKIHTLLPGLISDLFSGGDVSSVEDFLTSVVQADVEGISGEYRDNANESIATDMVIHSIRVHVNLSPSLNEVMAQVREQAKEMVLNELKGVFA